VSSRAGVTTGRRAELVEVDSDFEDYAYARGWTDGLPVVEPTGERVGAMVAATGLDATDVVAVVEPGDGVATVEAIAANAVMAGARPEHARVVVAAVRAATDPAFNLKAVQATTNPVAPAVLVNGPVARELGFNGGSNCFGQGNRSNAVVGRALRFCLLNIGYGTPGDHDMSTQGQPGKYTFCFAENEAESPWEPHHVERGFTAATSCVTVLQAGMLLGVSDFASTTAEGLLTSVADAMSGTNTNNLHLGRGDLFVVLSPDHAAQIAREGLGKDDVRRFLAEHARVPVSRFGEELRRGVLDFRGERYRDAAADTLLPVVEDAADIRIAVAGGAGAMSAVITGFGDGRSVCAAV
jgi:hypothetical protein